MRISAGNETTRSLRHKTGGDEESVRPSVDWRRPQAGTEDTATFRCKADNGLARKQVPVAMGEPPQRSSRGLLDAADPLTPQTPSPTIKLIRRHGQRGGRKRRFKKNKNGRVVGKYRNTKWCECGHARGAARSCAPNHLWFEVGGNPCRCAEQQRCQPTRLVSIRYHTVEMASNIDWWFSQDFLATNFISLSSVGDTVAT
jgi:hypothetical protein